MYEIDVSEVEKVLKIKTRAGLEDVARDLINYIKLEAPVDTGRLRQSFQILGVNQDKGLLYVGTNLNYAAHVHFGAPPHKPHWESLLKWTRRKLGADKTRAAEIFNKIESFGTDANPYMDRAIERLRKKYV